MSYGDFTIDIVRREFGIALAYQRFSSRSGILFHRHGCSNPCKSA